MKALQVIYTLQAMEIHSTLDLDRGLDELQEMGICSPSDIERGMLVQVVDDAVDRDDADEVPIIMWDRPHSFVDPDRSEVNLAEVSEIGLVIATSEEDVLCLIAGKFGWIGAENLEVIQVH